MVSKQDQEQNFIKKAKQLDNESFIFLKQKHLGLFIEISKKYFPCLAAKNISSEDIIEDYPFILFKALSSYKFEKNTKFSTWLANHVRYHCLNLLTNSAQTSSLSEISNSTLEKNLHFSEKNLDLQQYFEYILKQLNDSRIEQIYKLRYFGAKKMPWRLIAAKMNLSIQAVINLHNKTRKLLKKKYLSREFYDKI